MPPVRCPRAGRHECASGKSSCPLATMDSRPLLEARNERVVPLQRRTVAINRQWLAGRSTGVHLGEALPTITIGYQPPAGPLNVGFREQREVAQAVERIEAARPKSALP